MVEEEKQPSEDESLVPEEILPVTESSETPEPVQISKKKKPRSIPVEEPAPVEQVVLRKVEPTDDTQQGKLLNTFILNYLSSKFTYISSYQLIIVYDRVHIYTQTQFTNFFIKHLQIQNHKHLHNLHTLITQNHKRKQENTKNMI